MAPYKLGEAEWRFISGSSFDLQTTKLRCRGYAVLVNGLEAGFVCLRTGVWYLLRGSEKPRPFETRQKAIEQLLANSSAA